jgi:hypothetical protein
LGDFDRFPSGYVRMCVHDVPGSPSANLLGARFVTGGDKGTDFPIMSRLGATLRKPFFTFHFSKKQWGVIFPAEKLQGDRERPHTHKTAAPFSGLTHLICPRSCLWISLPTPLHSCLFLKVLQRIYLCFLCKLNGWAGRLLLQPGELCGSRV